MKLTETSLRRPVTTMMVFVSLVVVGLISARMLPLEFFPDITFPGAFVQVPYPNSSPEEIEKNITRPIEEVLATLTGVESMNSNSGENQSGVFVRFKMGTDMDLKSIEIREKIDGVRHLMPDDMERYNVFRFSAQDSPVLNLRLSSERDLTDAYDLLNRNLKLRLERLNGVGQVTMYGADQKQVRVELMADRMVSHNIHMGDLIAQLRQANFSLNAGRITDGNMRYNIRPVGELRSPEDVAALRIGDGTLRLSDIATVSYEPPVREYGRHLDMKYAIGLDITKESGANTVEVVESVLREIENINKLPEMAGIRIYEMHNQAEGILSSLRELLNAGAIGAFLSILVLYLFLRQFTTTMIVALAVPFSLIVTLGMLYFLGLSLNILSMMGLMLAVGMLVDNAVVVTENIHSNQRLNPDRKKATLLGVKQVGMAVTAGTLTTIIVFLPNIVSEDSMIAVQLYHVAITIIIALLASLAISLTIIPLLTTRIKVPAQSTGDDWIDRMINRYGRILGWLMRHKWTSGGIVLLTLFSVTIPMKFVNVDMFPRMDQRELMLHFNLNDAFVLDKVKESVDQIEQYLYANQEEFDIESVYSFYTPEVAQSTIILKDSKKTVEEIKKAIEENLPRIAIGQPSFEFQSRNINDEVRVYVIGESTEVLENLAGEAIRRLSRVEGITNARSETEMGREEVQVMVDRVRASRYGLSSNEVAQTVSGAMRGQNLRRIRGTEGEVDVILAYQNVDRQSLDDLSALAVGSVDGETVSLHSLAELNVRRGPSTIRRENRETSFGIRLDLDGITTEQARTTISEVMSEINYPTGYGWSYGRNFRQDQEAMDEMIVNIFLALILIYLVMAAVFESVLFPSSIITSIFFAIIGVFWFFFITGTTFDLMAMIGILVLMGIVVNNGIVLIDHINQLRAEGMSRLDAVVNGGKNRFRPILMTAATTVLGLIPLCLATTQIGGDGPPYFPMARAIVGGLTFSTLITLIILPTIYILLDDLKAWSGNLLREANR